MHATHGAITNELASKFDVPFIHGVDTKIGVRDKSCLQQHQIILMMEPLS